DPGGDPAALVFEKVSGPDWVTVDPGTGALAGDSTGRFGTAEVVIRATDPHGASDTATVTLRILAQPVIVGASATLVEGAALAETLAVEDADSPADALTFALASGPDWIAVDPATGRITGDTAGHPGSFTVVIRVTDADGLSDTAALDLRVLAAPKLAGAGVTLVEGEALSLPLSATDADLGAGA